MKGIIKKVLFILLLLFLERTVYAQPAYYTVTAGELNVRSGPGSQFSKVTQLHKGETIIVQYMYDGDWAAIKVASSTCYISRKYIEYKGPVPVQQQQQQPKPTTKQKNKNNNIGDVGIFWICIILAIIFYIASFNIEVSKPFASIFVNLLSAASLIVWTVVSDECYWFLDFEKQNIFAFLFCFFITACAIGIIFGTAWNNIKLITDIRHEPLSSIIFFVIGCVWGILLLRLVGRFFDEHPIMAFLIVMSAFSSGGHIPTIYVPGEGYITGHGHHGGSEFTGDNGHEYWYDGDEWHPH
jgi:hypothetical protein